MATSATARQRSNASGSSIVATAEFPRDPCGTPTVPIDLEPSALHNPDALTDQWRLLAEHSGALRLLRLFDEAIEAGRRAAQSASAS
jgi:hypothetical protein